MRWVAVNTIISDRNADLENSHRLQHSPHFVEQFNVNVLAKHSMTARNVGNLWDMLKKIMSENAVKKIAGKRDVVKNSIPLFHLWILTR